jgi:peptidoglycan-N-acetylglucosamine deacetylase
VEGPADQPLNAVLVRHASVATLLTAAVRLSAPAVRMCVTRVADESRTLYLTFDDGPDPATTQRLLDLLEARMSTATFFLIGENARRYPGLARRIAESGHTVGQHTNTHIDPWRARYSLVRSEMVRATAVIEEATGQSIGWMRPPYGHITPGIARWARENGQRIALWDVMPADFLASATAEGVALHVEAKARPGSLVVLHEGGRAAAITPPAVGRILGSARANGFHCGCL